MQSWFFYSYFSQSHPYRKYLQRSFDEPVLFKHGTIMNYPSFRGILFSQTEEQVELLSTISYSSWSSFYQKHEETGSKGATGFHCTRFTLAPVDVGRKSLGGCQCPQAWHRHSHTLMPNLTQMFPGSLRKACCSPCSSSLGKQVYCMYYGQDKKFGIWP